MEHELSADEAKQLLDAYRNGSIEALETLVERYRRPLYAFILRMLQRGGDADEIFQEVWLRAIRSMDSFDNRNLLSWLFRIAHNLMIDRIRVQGRTMSIDQAIGGENSPSLMDTLKSEAEDPAKQAAQRDMAAKVADLVTRLPPEQREVFVMRTEAELPFKEIARIQGVSINTALARMQYALSKLRAGLKKEW